MAEAFDSSPIYSMMRRRHHDLRDRVQKLMVRESALEAAVTAGTASSAKLKAAIAQVLQIPADASELERTERQTAARLEIDLANLATVQEELSLVRDAMKFADMAHEALHWGRFADQKLARFDQEKAVAAEGMVS